eukprot:g16537.t1
MADFDLDLYGDLKTDVQLRDPPPVKPPTPPWRKQSSSSAQAAPPPEIEHEGHGAAVFVWEDPRSVFLGFVGLQHLRRLHPVFTSGGSYDVLRRPTTMGFHHPRRRSSRPGAGAEEDFDDLDDPGLDDSGPEKDLAPDLEVSEDEFEAPAKRPRLQAVSRDEAEDGFDFEFEADLQKASESKVSRNSTGGMLSEDGLSSTQIVLAAPTETTVATKAPSEEPPATTSKYVYNGRMKRWELRTLKVAKQPPQDDPHASQDNTHSGPGGVRQKVKLCRFFAIRGSCKWGDRCFYAHNEAELSLGHDVASQQRIISECAYKAWEDAEGGSCSYAAALAVRLAIRFEAQPHNLLPTMEKTGLPMLGGPRATVKMLLRLCHPDKCNHPEDLLKRAFVVLKARAAKNCTKAPEARGGFEARNKAELLLWQRSFQSVPKKPGSGRRQSQRRCWRFASRRAQPTTA